MTARGGKDILARVFGRGCIPFFRCSDRWCAEFSRGRGQFPFFSGAAVRANRAHLRECNKHGCHVAGNDREHSSLLARDENARRPAIVAAPAADGSNRRRDWGAHSAAHPGSNVHAAGAVAIAGRHFVVYRERANHQMGTRTKRPRRQAPSVVLCRLAARIGDRGVHWVFRRGSGNFGACHAGSIGRRKYSRDERNEDADCERGERCGADSLYFRKGDCVAASDRDAGGRGVGRIRWCVLRAENQSAEHTQTGDYRGIRHGGIFFHKEIKLGFGVFEGLAEPDGVDLVACDLARAKENDGHIVGVEFAQLFVVVDIHFVEGSSELAENGKNCGASFIAEMAFRPRIQRGGARLGNGEASLFTATIHISAARGIERAGANEQFDGAGHVVAAPWIAAARYFHQSVEVERVLAKFVEYFQDAA